MNPSIIKTLRSIIKSNKFIRKTLWVCLACLLVLCVVNGLFGVTSARSLVSETQTTGLQNQPPGTYSFQMVLKNLSDLPKSIRIIVDDCLEELKINGVPWAGLAQIPQSSKCDYNKGFVVETKSLLETVTGTEAKLDWKIHNNGGYTGVKVIPESKDLKGILPFIVLVFSLGLLAGMIPLFHRRLLAVQWLIYGVFLLLIALYMSVTPAHLRGYDVGGHIDHIDLVQKLKLIPGNNDCWECTHQPLYYWAMAALTAVSSIRSGMGEAIAQGFSVLCMALTILFSFLGIRAVFRQRKNVIIAVSLLMAFWPSMILHSTRISNDCLFYLFSAISFYLLAEKRFFPASICIALAMFSKTSAIAFVPVFFVVMAAEYLFVEKNFKKWIKPLAVILLSLLIVVAVHKYKGELVNRIASLNGGLKVENHLGTVMGFSWEQYFKTPYVDPWSDEGGRKYFLIYSLKSSLWGEFIIKNHYGEIFAFFWSVIVLVLFLHVFFRILVTRLEIYRSDYILLLSAASFVSYFMMSFLFRFKYPFSCMGDFRFIQPVIFPWLILWMWQEKIFYPNSKLISFLGNIFIVVIGPLSTVLYYILLWGTGD